MNQAAFRATALALALSTFLAAQSASAEGSVPPARIAYLAKGINLYGWLGDGVDRGGDENDREARDAAFIKGAGFTFCRLPLAPELLFDPKHPEEPKPAIAAVDGAVRTLLDAGLAVVLDPIHESSAKDDWESRLHKEPAFRAAVSTYWEALARHFAAISGDRVFFEIMNEPHLSAKEKIDQAWWRPIQEGLASAIRRGAPSNTIIATGEAWGGIGGLLELEPLADRDVVYSFHFYEPMTFTHQGASWAGPIQGKLAGIPYPSSPDEAIRIAAGLPDVAAKRQVLSYGGQSWDEARIREELSRVADWGHAHLVPVFCGEFGVYRRVAPPVDRLRWIADVRKSLEALGIGWSMWEYEGDFGIVGYSEPRWRRGIQVDAACLSALGLDSSQTMAEGPDGPTIASFVAGSVLAIELPVRYWDRLWTRDKDTGTEKGIRDKAGNLEFISIDTKGGQDWVLASGFRIPLRGGETFELSSEASLSEGSLSMELVTRDESGKVISGSYAAVKAAVGPMTTLVARFVVPPSVASVEARWSGSGASRATVTAFHFARLAAASSTPPASNSGTPVLP
ncbi:MAG TPA: cellulase family glycosylhydrolase [Rectinemataceae bacterium]|nr:cellulase family glycosylhydrolase [Rectinemataceae bacterium]